MSQPHIPSDSPLAGRKFPTLAKRVIKRLIQGLAALAIFVVVGFAILFTSLWREHQTEIALPTPTGQFAVGRTIYTWVNHSEMDELSPSPGVSREVVVWTWYPAAASAAAVDDLPAPWRLALEQHSGVLRSRFLTRDLSVVRPHGTSDPDARRSSAPIQS